MFTLKRALELVFLGLVYLSAVLLGFSQGNWQLAVISIIGATLAWILVDWLNLIRMPRWLANVLRENLLCPRDPEMQGMVDHFRILQRLAHGRT
jgi:uncharacterized membrane protein YjjP (DUF1212 family)